MLVKKKGTGKFEQVSKDELKKILLKLTGIDFDSYKKNGFDIRARSSKDHFKKVQVYRNVEVLTNSFSITEDGEATTYGFCTNIRVMAEGGVTQEVLMPRVNQNLRLKKLSQSEGAPAKKIISINDLDMLVYFLLYPACVHSPFNKSGIGYTLHNDAKNATATVASAKEQAKAQLYILQDCDIERLAAYIQGKGQKNVSILSEDEIREKAWLLAQKDVKKFMAEIRSSDVNIKADAQKFVDEGLMKFKENGLRKEWRIGFGEDKGDFICDVPSGQDKMAALADFFKANTSTYDFFKNQYQSKTSLTGKARTYESDKNGKLESGETEERWTEAKQRLQIKSTEEDKTPLLNQEKVALIDKLLTGGVIRYVALQKAVSVFDEQGRKVPKKDGGDLVNNVTAETWRQELDTFIQTQEGAVALQNLTRRV